MLVKILPIPIQSLKKTKDLLNVYFNMNFTI